MKILLPILSILFILNTPAKAQKQEAYQAIHSGIPWFDNQKNIVSAHGACIVKENNRFYFFGEKHSDSSNVFTGFNCYSSTDLYNWTFESIALPVQNSGRLAANRVGERAKVMKCPKTGEFVMFMHTDSTNYKDQCVGYAISKTITGPYVFKGPLLFNGNLIRKWDMGTFQDNDGSGYILIHGGEIYKLNDDYKSVVKQVHKNISSGFESPTIFRKDSTYYFLGSHLTSWERNDNYYYTANSLEGPWAFQGLFAPQGTLTWNSQSTFVLPIKGSKETTYMFMGDRWSFPRQASAATYIWQPFIIAGTSLSLPSYKDTWKINLKTGVVTYPKDTKKVISHADKKSITYTGQWQNNVSDTLNIQYSNEKGASFSVNFTGKQIGFYGLLRPDGGYAKVNVVNSKGKKVLSALVDMYCKYPIASLVFLSPSLPKDKYQLTVTVTGEHGTWSDKRKSNYGSTDNFVSLSNIIINE